MKRILSFAAGFSLLLTGLSLGVAGGAMAMTASVNSGGGCNGGYPAPYTGGAGVAKYFHLSDGSTVTITTTGAVIKQSPCQTAYREGWISVSSICGINSAQDLNGHLSSGSSNPNGSGNFNGCSTSVQSPAPAARPTESATPAQTQSQSQSITVNTTPQVLSASSTHPASKSASSVKTLPNTGPGNVLALAGAATAVGAAGHWLFSRRTRFYGKNA